MADFEAVKAFMEGGIHAVPLPDKFIEMSAEHETEEDKK